MPHKHNKRKRHHIKKAVYRLRNYAQYNQSLKNRGKMSIWLSSSIIESWQNDMRYYDGRGSTVKYPDSTIEACHYIRMVFKLSLRQAQGFIEN
ncbi:transposase [Shewanella sairae]|nr:transposase [Shewanella sairae]